MADLSKRAANDRVERLQARLKGMSSKAREEGNALIGTGVALGTGAGLGVIDEWSVNRNGRPALIGNIDNSLLVGALATGAAIMGVGTPDMTRYMRGIGNTAFGLFAYKWVYQAMVDRRREAGARETRGAAAPAAEGRGAGVRGAT